MKAIFCFVVVLLATVHAKKELEVSDCGGAASILTLGSITDSKAKGRIDKTSTLTLLFSSTKDTHKLDPFDVDVEIKIQKKVGLWFVDVPESLMTQIGLNIAKMDKRVQYLGKNIFRFQCLFEDLYGSCLPKKGPHLEHLPMGQIFTFVKKKFGSIVRWFASGWYKVHFTAKTKKESVFCVNSKFQLDF